MEGYWFYLSHAHLDREDDPKEVVRTFYQDLERRMKRAEMIREGDAGFFDGTGIQQGASWPETLASALGTCRVFVCLYSPAYFSSEWCGKEFAVFNQRLFGD